MTAMDNTQVIILGMGRSGTSMLAGVCWRLGVFMGEWLQAPGPINPTGFWEDREIAYLHHALLQGELHPRPDQPPTREMIEFVQRRDRQHLVWGFKDFHTTLAIHAWDQLFSRPRYLWATRRPEAVVASYRRAWDMPDEWVRALWRVVTGHLSAFFETRAHLRVDYDDLLATRDVGRIADFVGLKNVDPSRARAFIQPDLNHFAQKVRAVS